MFFEFFSHAIALDFGFFIDLVLNNLFFVFTVYAAIYFFLNKKRVAYFTILFAILMWVYTDMQSFTGLAWVVPSFLLLYYITKLAIVALVESTPALKKYVLIISTLQFYVLFLIYNFFLR